MRPIKFRDGDIVKTKWGGIGSVEFTDGSFYFIFEKGEVKILVNSHESEKRKIEIIGNIYQNPELLK